MTFLWTTLHVTDLERSLHFYHELLGLPVAERFGPPEREIVMLGDGTGTKLELLCGPTPGPLGQGVSLGFAPDDMAALLESLKADGIALPTPVSPNPTVRFYFIQDPDGYTVQLVEHLS